MSTRKRSSYTVEYKLKVVAWYKANGENKHATARQFGLDCKRLREWLEKEDRLRAKGVGVGKKRRKLHEGGKTLSAELDKAVLDFMLGGRMRGKPELLYTGLIYARPAIFACLAVVGQGNAWM